MTHMKPWSKRGWPSRSPVRASTTTERKSSVGSGVGVMVTHQILSASSACETNWTTRSGCWARATSSILSRLVRGVFSAIGGASISVPSRWPIS